MLIGNPQQDQRRIYAAVRRLLAWLARRRAMVLVLDDLQWADPSSLAAVGTLIGSFGIYASTIREVGFFSTIGGGITINTPGAAVGGEVTLAPFRRL